MFGGGKKGDSGSSYSCPVISTGGQIDGIVSSLIAAAYDKVDTVKEAIARSLKEIGAEQPQLVLSSCGDFLTNNKKCATEHRIIVLNIMVSVLKDNLEDVKDKLGYNLVLLGVGEMTATSEIQPLWQEAALQLLTTLGLRWGKAVLDELLKKTSESKGVPHFFIIKALGDLAAANPMYVVPNVKEMFGRMLPLLGMIKHNNQRWVMAATLGQFCEAITNYLKAKKEQNLESEISISSFHGEVYTAFEVMFNQWVEIKEPKVRLAVVVAVGHASRVMARDQFENVLPKLVQTYLGLYKKEKDPLPISQGLYMILDTATLDNSGILDSSLQATMTALHALVSTPFKEDDANAVKNFNELLRCFEVMGRAFPEQVVGFLLGRFESPTRDHRVGTLLIIRHIVTRLVDELAPQRELLVSGVKPLLTETDLKVRKAFAQVVIAMASHEYLNLEGGEALVEFVVQCSSITDGEIEKAAKAKPSKEKGEVVTPEDLRNMADNILNLVTTTIPCMIEVLWPFLFECVVPDKFTPALATVCKCLTHLAEERQESESDDYYIDFDRLVNLPKPPAIIARLLTMLSTPLERGDLGRNILELLQSVGEVLHPSIADLWDDLIPKLIKWLEAKGNPTDFVDTAWEELVQRFLSLTIDEINDDDWVMALGEELEKQYALYHDEFSSYKRMVHKLLGIVLKKTTHKKFVREKLNQMFAVVEHADAEERKGLAQGFGFAASSHLDTVLEKLLHATKNDMVRKSTGLFGLKKNKSSSDVENIRCTVVLSYGYVAAYAETNLITSRMEVHVLNNLLPQFDTAKVKDVKDSLIKATELVSKAMHPSHLGTESFLLKQRDDLILKLLGFVVERNVEIEIAASAFGGFSSLALLEPAIPPELVTKVVDSSLAVAYDLDPKDKDKDKMEAKEKQIAGALDNLNTFMCSMLFMSPTVATITALFRNVEKYVTSDNVVRRRRATATMAALLNKYVDDKTAAAEEREEDEEPEELDEAYFGELGHWVGVAVPRCTDPDVDVRTTAMEIVELILTVDHCLQEGDFLADLPKEVAAFETLKNKITTTEANEQFSVVHGMTQVLAATVSADEMPDLLSTLTSGLNDLEASSASGTCVVLNGLMRMRGPELKEHIADLLTGMLGAMEKINNEQTMNGTLHALRTLGGHHLVLVLEHLLSLPVPHSPHVVKALQVLAKDDALAVRIVNHLVHIVINDMPYEMKGSGSKTTKSATEKPVAATASIGDIFESADLEDVVQDHLDKLLATLILRIATTSDVAEKDARERAVNALKTVLACGKEEEIIEALNGGDHWEKLVSPQYAESLVALGAFICEHRDDLVPELFRNLSPFLSRNYPEQRVAVAAVFSAFIEHAKEEDDEEDEEEEEEDLLKRLLNAVLVKLGDECEDVKMYAYRALGNVAASGEDAVNEYATTVLSALMSGMDAPSDRLVLEAMNALSKILALVEGTNVAPVLITLCLRIKPHFRKESEEIRSSAFTLFGTLTRFGEDEAAEKDFYEQMHTNLIGIILHSGDPDENVMKACRKTLTLIAPLMGVDEIEDLFVTATNDDFDYAAFLDETSRLLIQNFPQRLNFYVMECVGLFDHQTWYAVKAHAAMFTGHFLGNMEAKERALVNIAHVCGALKNLLKEPQKKGDDVRAKAAEAMALIFDV